MVDNIGRVLLSVSLGVLVCYFIDAGIDHFKNDDYFLTMLSFIEGLMIVVMISLMWYGVTV